MATASLNISVTEKRMMNEAEAASYCGLPTKHFRNICPVRPLALGGRETFDKRDLDQWIDTEKAGVADMTRDSILARL
jgi:hypothetical protein